MRLWRPAALLVAALFVISACGARLPAAERQQAANAVLSGRTTVEAGGSGTSSAAPTAAPASSNLVKPGSTCPTSGSGTGLTPTTITLGQVADVTGPVPGLFASAEQGLKAWANYVNSTGGLCGRQIKIDFGDGATSCTANEAATSSLVSKVFAMVGSFSLFDNCGATILKQHPTLADVHDSLTTAAEVLPNHFDLTPGPLGAATGPWIYLAKRLGASKIQHTGTITSNVPSALDKENAQLKAARTVGFKFDEDVTASTQGDFLNDFQKMCGQQHIQVFYASSETAQNAATMLHDENQVSACKGLVNIMPIAYDQNFLAFCKQVDCGANENTVIGSNAYVLFFNPNEATKIPELKLFQTWFHKTYPGKPIALFSLLTWANGRLFQQAFETAGPTATQETVLAALHKITSFNDNGMLAPADPGRKSTGDLCYINWTLHNQVFNRVADPKTGFNCNGTFVKD